MSKVIVCPRCNRRSQPGTIICECGEMLGGIEPIEYREEKRIPNEVGSKDNNSSYGIVENRGVSKNIQSTSAGIPALSWIFYMLAGLSFLGGIVMANDKSLSFVPPLYLVVAGFINATIFLFMGQVIFYLNRLLKNR